MPGTIDKSYILDKIRRTAADNGGKPLGVGRFRSETGIRRSDWLGVYWARWGDAVSEAGLSPNQLQRAYGSDELVKFYADLAKEIGHLPVNDEVKIKHRRDPGFPGWEPFSRLGSRLERIRTVAEYCKGNHGYEDVLSRCEEYLVCNSKTVEPDHTISKESPLGCVYLVKSGRYHKIGKTNSIGRREYELGLQLPERAKTVHVITTDDPGGIEAYWHKRFEARRKNGEWFELTREDIAAFKRRRKFM
jgi:hypothetical protein